VKRLLGATAFLIVVFGAFFLLGYIVRAHALPTTNPFMHNCTTQLRAADIHRYVAHRICAAAGSRLNP
jgi:hypothetical protein